MERRVGSGLQRLVGVLLVVVAVGTLVTPRLPNITYHWWVVAPTAAVALLLATRFRVPPRVLGPHVPVGVAIGGGIVSIVLGQLLRYGYGWDAGYINSIARTIQQGRPLVPEVYDYLSLYPNNVPLIAIERAGAAVGAGLGLSANAVLITLNGLCVGVTLYAVHALVVRVAGRGAALVAQLLVLGLVGLSPWVSVVYTDLYAMPFTVGALALVVAAWQRPWGARAAVLGILGLASAAAAYVVKTTPVVLVVAIVVCLLLAVGASASDREVGLDSRRRNRQRAGAVASAVAALAVFLGASAVLTGAAGVASGVDLSRVREGVSPPLLWWVANGMDVKVDRGNGHVSYGSYSQPMVDAIEGRDQVQMRDYSRSYIETRWQERGLSGTAAFYADKAVWNWGDGMFWAWGEGLDARPGVYRGRGPVTTALAEVNGLHGTLYPLRADLTEGLWLALLLGAGVGLLRAPFRRDVLLLALSVLGIGLFTLLFQGRSRYLFVFVPVVVALAASVRPSLPLVGATGWRRVTGRHRATSRRRGKGGTAGSGRPGSPDAGVAHTGVTGRLR